MIQQALAVQRKPPTQGILGVQHCQEILGVQHRQDAVADEQVGLSREARCVKTLRWTAAWQG